MRTLKRNQREIYYATLIKGEPVTDEWGNETGEYNMVYSDPLPIRINVSAAQGEVGNQTVRTDGKLRQDVNYRRYGLSN